MTEVKSIFENPLYMVQEKKVSKGDNQIDKEAFLKLLIAQLKYQDPLNPVNNTEFIGQLTMFSALEKIMNIDKTLEKIADSQLYLNAFMIGSNIVGKTIVTTDGSEYKAQGIVIEDEAVKINTGNQYINITQIREIRA